MRLFVNKQAGQHGLYYTVDARSEEVKRIGFPLVAFPLNHVAARLDINRRRVALRHERVCQAGEHIGVLRYNLIRNLILFVNLHFQTVVLHAELTFGLYFVAFVCCIKLVDVAMAGDADERTNERIEVIRLCIFGFELEFERGGFVHMHCERSIDLALLAERRSSMTHPYRTRTVRYVRQAGVDILYMQLTAVDVSRRELDIHFACHGVDIFDTELHGHLTQELLRCIEGALRFVALVAEYMHSLHIRMNGVKIVVVLKCLVYRIDCTGAYAVQLQVYPCGRLMVQVCQCFGSDDVAQTRVSDAQRPLVFGMYIMCLNG